MINNNNNSSYPWVSTKNVTPFRPAIGNMKKKKKEKKNEKRKKKNKNKKKNKKKKKKNDHVWIYKKYKW